MLTDYHWDGNIRQLKNVTEQISIIEHQRDITAETVKRYLPHKSMNTLPILFQKDDASELLTDRDLLYKVLFDMKKDITDLRNLVNTLMARPKPETTYMQPAPVAHIGDTLLSRVSKSEPTEIDPTVEIVPEEIVTHEQKGSLSLEENEKEMIYKALEKHKGKRKDAAKELGISERTLYRKINEYGINA